MKNREAFENLMKLDDSILGVARERLLHICEPATDLEKMKAAMEANGSNQVVSPEWWVEVNTQIVNAISFDN